MPIENTEYGTLVTGDSINLYMIHAAVGALCLSITIGGRPGLMDQMGHRCGSSKRTKKGVLEDYVVWMHEQGLTLNAQWGSVERALGADRAAKLKRKCDKILAKGQDKA